MTPGVIAHVRNRIGQGLLIVLPMLITLWLLSILFQIIHGKVTPGILAVLRAAGVPWLDLWPARVLVPVIGVVLTAATVYLIGLLAGNLMGRRILRLVESAILRVPLVKGIYGSARQLLDAFSVTSTKAFSKVVLVEYPRRGLWTVGFVTSEREQALGYPGERERKPSVPVFLPTTPNPTSGWMLLVPHEELVVLDMSIEEAVKLIVSGGIVSPDDLSARAHPWGGSKGALPSGERSGRV